jgi:hypothetical protein
MGRGKEAVKKARPIRRRVVRDAKDFMQIKFKGRSRSRPAVMAYRRRHHSKHNPPRGLRQPRTEWSCPAYALIERYTGESGFRCDTRGCQNHGFGPMLRTMIWKRHFAGRQFQCEPCMVRVLGRPLNRYDLRSCPMNLCHPAFDVSLEIGG